MKKRSVFLGLVYLVLTSFYPTSSEKKHPQTKIVIPEKRQSSVKKETPKDPAETIYKELRFDDEVLDYEVFARAYFGFQKLKTSRNLQSDAHLLSVCDFSLSSCKKRLWVIDLDAKKILFNTLVAHGKETGEEFAVNFSNIEDSHQSSLGFYITNDAYDGDNGYSLRLSGMDKGYNDFALERCIVIHGAKYVSEDFIKTEKRLGRSWGCPAVPRELAQPIIDAIKDRTCFFIYFPDDNYLNSSEWLRKEEPNKAIKKGSDI